MMIASKVLVNKVIETLDPEVRDLFHGCNTEDHEEIDVAIFSDDGMTTQIEFATNRKDTIRVLALLNSSELLGGLAAVRASGKRVQRWGILDW